MTDSNDYKMKQEQKRIQKNKTNQKYYYKNKDLINNKQKKEIICTCGQTIKRSSQHYHLKSMKHRKALLSIQSPETEWNLYKEHMNNEYRLS